MSTIGSRIRTLREKMNWTQRVAAKKLGIAQTVLCKIETDFKVNLSPEFLLKCSEVFDVSIDFIVKGSDVLPEEITDKQIDLLSHKSVLDKINKMNESDRKWLLDTIERLSN